MTLTTPVEGGPQTTAATTSKTTPTRTVTVGGTPFAYREFGPRTGVPLVLLHHFTAVLASTRTPGTAASSNTTGSSPRSSNSSKAE